MMSYQCAHCSRAYPEPKPSVCGCGSASFVGFHARSQKIEPSEISGPDDEPSEISGPDDEPSESVKPTRVDEMINTMIDRFIANSPNLELHPLAASFQLICQGLAVLNTLPVPDALPGAATDN